MTTKGYEPYSALAYIMYDFREATYEEVEGARVAIDEILGASGRSLIEKFQAIAHRRKFPWRQGSEQLVYGLLECLDSPGWYTDPEDLLGGIYDHFKGGIYKLRGFSSWASGEGQPVIEYTSLIYGTDHTRFVSEWCEVVQWPDGKYRSRFVYRGPDLTAPAPIFKVPMNR